MMYSNARNGIKLIYIAQILTIISTFLSNSAGLNINILIDYFDNYLDFFLSPLGIANVLFIILSIIIMAAAAALEFIGCFQATKDEPEFKKSMVCVVIVAAFYTVSLFFKIPNGTLFTIFSIAGMILEMFVMTFAVSGIINISVNCENDRMEKKGDRVMMFILVSYLASSVNSIIYRIFELSEHIQIVALIIGALDLLLTVSQFIVFMSYLRHTLVMLKPEKKNE